MIPIDFVAGTHGHFLEVFLNKVFGFVPENFSPFGPLGTSHITTSSYSENKLFDARHWFEHYQSELEKHFCSVVITFDTDDLLLVSSLSLLRAADLGIHNNELEIDTIEKLNNEFYKNTLDSIFSAYPFLDKNSKNIPRYVLREYFKFGFKTPTASGYWKQLQSMLDIHHSKNFRLVPLKNLYCYKNLLECVEDISAMITLPYTVDNGLKQFHNEFLSKLQFKSDKHTCDKIIDAVKVGENLEFSLLTMFQESYINAQLENIFQKEMPFYQDNYFTNTKDMLNYLKEKAPSL